MEPFDNGTVEVAEAAAELTTSGQLVSIAGGGDTMAALNLAGVTGRFTYVSTAGGAFLEWLEGKMLPGVEVLKAAPHSRRGRQCGIMRRLSIRTSRNAAMNLTELNKVAEAMVAPGRGILAADELSGTIKKRFDAIGVESTRDHPARLSRTAVPQRPRRCRSTFPASSSMTRPSGRTPTTARRWSS